MSEMNYDNLLAAQRKQFLKNMSSAAEKLPLKRTAAAAGLPGADGASSSSSLPIVSAPTPSVPSPSLTYASLGDMKKPFGFRSTSAAPSSVTNILLKIVDFLRDKHRNKALGITSEFRFDELLVELNERMLTIEEQDQLIGSLRSNPKIACENERFRFLPKYSVENKEELLELLRQYYMQGHGGIIAKELTESYDGVDKDVEALAAENRIFKILKGTKGADHVLFYNDPRLILELDEEFKTMWSQVKTLSNTDIQDNLIKAGIQPLKIETPAEQEQEATKGKKSSNRRITKLTNTHLVGIDLTHDIEIPKKK